MKASQLFGIQIKCESAQKEGYIMAISRVEDRIEGYICCNQQETEFFAESAGAKIKDGKLCALTTGKRSKASRNLKLGQPVYSEDGKFLGHVDDYEISANRLTGALVGRRKFPFERLTIGDVVIVRNDKTRTEIAAKDMFIGAITSTQ
ncbi:MAG: PRC-barrel domain-containing protein [Clostridia bacterium]|nr:PRC-barrel domain-containing protein [Clostridia bacterium]